MEEGKHEVKEEVDKVMDIYIYMGLIVKYDYFRVNVFYVDKDQLLQCSIKSKFLIYSHVFLVTILNHIDI